MDFVKFRDWLPRDRAMVVDNWIRSFRSSRHAGPYSYEAYHKAMRETVNTLLDVPGTKVAVAVNSQESDPMYEIMGYVVYGTYGETKVVHWIYVKDGLRRHGLGRSLLTHTGFSTFAYTYRTMASDKAIQWLARKSDVVSGYHQPKLVGLIADSRKLYERNEAERQDQGSQGRGAVAGPDQANTIG